MTKSRHFATRLRLSKLVRILAVLCCLKVAALGMAFFDLPLSHWFGGESSSRKVAEAGNPKAGESPDAKETARRLEEALQAQQGGASVALAPNLASAPDSSEKPALSSATSVQPQGSAAAELAAAARPRAHAQTSATGLPAPIIADGLPGAGFSHAANQEQALNGPSLPTPPPLPSPLAPAGILAPKDSQASSEDGESAGLWNLLGLNSLPIPGLGSAREAHAAALEMPVPATPPASQSPSPFAPAAQATPMGMSQPASQGSTASLPGAGPIPANIPRGQSADGSPLPPRGTDLPSLGQGSSPLAAMPQSDTGATWPAPAPRVTPQAAPIDPNAKAQELARQQQDILMLRQQMDQRLKDLQNAEGKMKDMIREARELEDKKVRNLVQMYANMKPRMAAQALENMDERVAVRILSGMAPKQSGEILTYTKPAKTAKFTELITRMRMPE